MLNIPILEKLQKAIFYCRIMAIEFLSGALKSGNYK